MALLVFITDVWIKVLSKVQNRLSDRNKYKDELKRQIEELTCNMNQIKTMLNGEKH